eukprot:1177114-Prorocentrum_minimum.AAC.2
MTCVDRRWEIRERRLEMQREQERERKNSGRAAESLCGSKRSSTPPPESPSKRQAWQSEPSDNRPSAAAPSDPPSKKVRPKVRPKARPKVRPQVRPQVRPKARPKVRPKARPKVGNEQCPLCESVSCVLCMVRTCVRACYRNRPW